MSRTVKTLLLSPMGFGIASESIQLMNSRACENTLFNLIAVAS